MLVLAATLLDLVTLAMVQALQGVVVGNRLVKLPPVLMSQEILERPPIVGEGHPRKLPIDHPGEEGPAEGVGLNGLQGQ